MSSKTKGSATTESFIPVKAIINNMMSQLSNIYSYNPNMGLYLMRQINPNVLTKCFQILENSNVNNNVNNNKTLFLIFKYKNISLKEYKKIIYHIIIWKQFQNMRLLILRKIL